MENELLNFLESVTATDADADGVDLERFEKIHESEDFGSELKILSNLIITGSGHPRSKRLAKMFSTYEQKFHEKSSSQADVCLKQHLVRFKLMKVHNRLQLHFYLLTC